MNADSTGRKIKRHRESAQAEVQIMREVRGLLIGLAAIVLFVFSVFFAVIIH